MPVPGTDDKEMYRQLIEAMNIMGISQVSLGSHGSCLVPPVLHGDGEMRCLFSFKLQS